VEPLITGTGNSELDDAHQAGRAAAATALEQLDGAAPALVLVYASVRYQLDDLLAGIRSVTGSVPLAGSTSCGHFAGEQVTAPGRGVAVLVLGGGDYQFGVASAAGMADGAEGVGTAVARAARAAAGPTDRRYAALILLTDGLGGDQQAVLTGVHRVLGAAVPVVGGAAADDRQLLRTSVFHDGAVLTDAAVAIWVGSHRPLTVSCAHGWKSVSLPLLVTSSQGPVVHEIGGRPAADVYWQLVRDTDARPTVPGGPVWQSSYALGLIEPGGSHLVRGVFATEGGPISTFTPLPAYSAVQVMTADPDTLLAVVDGVISDSLVYGDETVILAFDCIARMDILGNAYPDEISRMKKAAGDALCFGTYTYGEFARAKGVGGVHNATLTTLAL
jgi:hypothetical protein